jgi:hypothetical protein
MKKTTKPTIKELMMAMPNKKRVKIYMMIEETYNELKQYDNMTPDVEKQYQDIIMEVALHIEVEQ